MEIVMTGPAWVALLALLAVLAVGALVVADQAAAADPEEPGPVVIDQSGRLLATQELPMFRPGRHRARRWSR